MAIVRLKGHIFIINLGISNANLVRSVVCAFLCSPVSYGGPLGLGQIVATAESNRLYTLKKCGITQLGLCYVWRQVFAAVVSDLLLWPLVVTSRGLSRTQKNSFCETR